MYMYTYMWGSCQIIQETWRINLFVRTFVEVPKKLPGTMYIKTAGLNARTRACMHVNMYIQGLNLWTIVSNSRRLENFMELDLSIHKLSCIHELIHERVLTQTICCWAPDLFWQVHVFVCTVSINLKIFAFFFCQLMGFQMIWRIGDKYVQISRWKFHKFPFQRLQKKEMPTSKLESCDPVCKLFYSPSKTNPFNAVGKGNFSTWTMKFISVFKCRLTAFRQIIIKGFTSVGVWNSMFSSSCLQPADRNRHIMRWSTSPWKLQSGVPAANKSSHCGLRAQFAANSSAWISGWYPRLNKVSKRSDEPLCTAARTGVHPLTSLMSCAHEQHSSNSRTNSLLPDRHASTKIIFPAIGSSTDFPNFSIKDKILATFSNLMAFSNIFHCFLSLFLAAAFWK